MSPKEKRIIMLVDDEIELGQACAKALEVDYTVVVMDKGSTAWSALNSGLRPHLLITDLHIFGVNGFRLIANVRDASHLIGLPIVLMSGDAQIHDIAASLGIPHVLPKPCDTNSLRKLVASIIGP